MTSEPSQDLLGVRDALREFASARDWDQFHSPRNLAASICIESAELLERFQWTDRSSDELTPDEVTAIRHELADVLLYLVRLADKLGIDPIAAAHEKIAINASKYPVDKARGSSRKYDQL
ncbi:MAG TPA: nucleotide pyrophosphohydrolase [Steroidobacteraceae bacterium]|nr:nucleotide pyrophosphohydrolase [Steroidobacteraceae bacterium]